MPPSVTSPAHLLPHTRDRDTHRGAHRRRARAARRGSKCARHEWRTSDAGWGWILCAELVGDHVGRGSVNATRPSRLKRPRSSPHARAYFHPRRACGAVWPTSDGASGEGGGGRCLDVVWAECGYWAVSLPMHTHTPIFCPSSTAYQLLPPSSPTSPAPPRSSPHPPPSFLCISSLVHPRPIRVHFHHYPDPIVPLQPLLLLFVRPLPAISRSSSSAFLSADYVSMGAYLSLAHFPSSRSQFQPDLPEPPGAERCTAGSSFPSPPAVLVAIVLAVVDDGDPSRRRVGKVSFAYFFPSTSLLPPPHRHTYTPFSSFQSLFSLFHLIRLSPADVSYPPLEFSSADSPRAGPAYPSPPTVPSRTQWPLSRPTRPPPSPPFSISTSLRCTPPRRMATARPLATGMDPSRPNRTDRMARYTGSPKGARGDRSGYEYTLGGSMSKLMCPPAPRATNETDDRTPSASGACIADATPFARTRTPTPPTPPHRIHLIVPHRPLPSKPTQPTLYTPSGQTASERYLPSPKTKLVQLQNEVNAGMARAETAEAHGKTLEQTVLERDHEIKSLTVRLEHAEDALEKSRGEFQGGFSQASRPGCEAGGGTTESARRRDQWKQKYEATEAKYTPQRRNSTNSFRTWRASSADSCSYALLSTMPGSDSLRSRSRIAEIARVAYTLRCRFRLTSDDSELSGLASWLQFQSSGGSTGPFDGMALSRHRGFCGSRPHSETMAHRFQRSGYHFLKGAAAPHFLHDTRNSSQLRARSLTFVLRECVGAIRHLVFSLDFFDFIRRSVILDVEQQTTMYRHARPQSAKYCVRGKTSSAAPPGASTLAVTSPPDAGP
ncbi:hypothetical protein DFH07DRAFT_768229 [Mycena maculata]|uniref:Uncharacterized protein n=1 Tax=Mycena maculata TaxID=230809 RepID=A0AAD7NR72_9AGAR|nr:hypothetical protein DFH07DRAFT_768229 [Mycena maculata]